MQQKPKISILNTQEFLSKKFDTSINELTALSKGSWSEAYSFQINNQKYVLRWANSSEGFAKDAFAHKYFTNDLLPIPEILEIGQALNSHYAISKFVDGEFFETIDSKSLLGTTQSLQKMFATIRSTDLSHTKGYGNWDKDGNGKYKSWKEFLLGVKKTQTIDFGGIYADLQNSPLGTDVFDKLYNKLETLVDYCPDNRELIHSDLLNYNMFIKNNRISGVIDWQCALYGDALYDLAWFIFYAPWYKQFAETNLCNKLLEHYRSTVKNVEHLEQRLLSYQIHIGLDSMIYNSFVKDWDALKVVMDYIQILEN
jgi:hygromycin-B 4-O-kinase